MSKPLYLYGFGGLGREVKALVKALPEWSLNGFYDEYIEKGSLIDGIICLGNLNDLLQTREEKHVILSIGNPVIKKKIVLQLVSNHLIKFPTLIHPSAILLDEASISIGQGSVITAGVAMTTAIKIGDHVLINLNSTIGHDTIIGDYCSIMPGVNLSGNVTLKEAVLIGSGATILNAKCISDNAIVGAGAVVTKHVDSGITVIGVPAQITKVK